MYSRIIIYSFMVLLLAAHFSHGNHDAFALITLALPFLFFIKKSWIIHLLQTIGYLSAIIWLYSAYGYIQLRIETNQGWIRLLIIMGTVALYSAWASYFLRSDKIKKNYGIIKEITEKDV